jgi:hypothetical protein
MRTLSSGVGVVLLTGWCSWLAIPTATAAAEDTGALTHEQEQPDSPASTNEARGRYSLKVEIYSNDPSNQVAAPTVQKPERPRTLADAHAVKFEKAGNRMGALKAYDDAFLDAIQSRWRQLIGALTIPAPGKTVVHFKLHPDGQISGLTVGDGETDGLFSALSLAAVLDCAPYARWTLPMRKLLCTDRRWVTITFIECDGSPRRTTLLSQSTDLVCELRYQTCFPISEPSKPVLFDAPWRGPYHGPFGPFSPFHSPYRGPGREVHSMDSWISWPASGHGHPGGSIGRAMIPLR